MKAPHLRRFLAAAAMASGAMLVAASAGYAATGPQPATVTHSAATPGIATPDYVSACPKVSAPGEATCLALQRTGVASHYGVVPGVTPSGFSPAQLAAAYKLPSTGGAGETVAIVDVYNNTTAAADLAVYRKQFGLPACTVANGCFSQVNQNLKTSPLPANNNSWAAEESLDVDAVSAACPACHIVLVEATSASNKNLYTAVNNAAKAYKFVSNSWGEAEYSGETNDDVNFNHPGVAIDFSAGDAAEKVLYPSASPYVTAVGGTSLATSTTAKRGWTEHAWDTSSSSSTGSGCSKYETQPTWQASVTNITNVCAKRATADVSAVADPNTGYAVYDTNGDSGWVVIGGTSGSVQFITGVYALAGNPAAGTVPASYPYAHPSNLYDITRGSTGTCGTLLCKAGKGWDGPTGMGTPNGVAAFK